MKNLKFYEILGLVILVALTIVAGVSCGKTAGQDLGGAAWILQSYGTEPNLTSVVPDKQTTIIFDIKALRISGSGGVNGYGGDYKVDGNKITFTGVIHTMLAVEGPVMGQENGFFKILDSAQTYKVDGKLLYIYGTEGELILTRE